MSRHRDLTLALPGLDGRLEDIDLGRAAALPGPVRELRTRVVRLVGAGAPREALSLKPREVVVVVLRGRRACQKGRRRVRGEDSVPGLRIEVRNSARRSEDWSDSAWCRRRKHRTAGKQASVSPPTWAGVARNSCAQSTASLRRATRRSQHGRGSARRKYRVSINGLNWQRSENAHSSSRQQATGCRAAFGSVSTPNLCAGELARRTLRCWSIREATQLRRRPGQQD